MSIESGDCVRLEYVGRFEDRSVVATSEHDVAEEHGLAAARDAEPSDFAPLSFTAGAGSVVEGLDEAVVGMTTGERARVTVPPEGGYGAYDPDRVREYDPDAFEGMVGERPEVGLHVGARNDRHGDVTAVSGDAVQVDFTHELAGKPLVLDIRVLDVA